jgi:response regulator of citrate/malate metabolism
MTNTNLKSNVAEVESNIIDIAVKQVNTTFTKEILPFTIIPKNKNQFVISILNIRGNQEILIDNYFNKKNGKLIKSEIISKKWSN